ncbi:TPA: hypothetical protein HA318_06310 [Candidatus Micrarchaeota archaeon]|nr:MAG: hypothetical protein AUJ65_01670 [Candidatus Micrarchaeota archaeon CG1_02_51_15]HII39582.1 hypothetical protein [Candidatus Micrarchaeota archaeon]
MDRLAGHVREQQTEELLRAMFGHFNEQNKEYSPIKGETIGELMDVFANPLLTLKSTAYMASTGESARQGMAILLQHHAKTIAEGSYSDLKRKRIEKGKLVLCRAIGLPKAKKK